MDGFKTLKEGATVDYAEGTGLKGPCATNVVPLQVQRDITISPLYKDYVLVLYRGYVYVQQCAVAIGLC